MQKKVLFIDDKDRSSIFKALIRKAKSKRMLLELYEFNPGGAKQPDLIDKDTNELDIPKTIERYREQLATKEFDAIACDWNLNVPNVNGLELLRQLAANYPRLRATPKMMYSGTLDEELRKMVKAIIESEEGEKNKKLDRFVADLRMLSQSEFFALSGRENVEDDLIPYLMKHEPLNIRVHHILKDNPNLKFSVHCGGSYAGKTFKEIRAEIINNEERERELLQDVIEEAVSALENKIAKT